MNVVMDDMKIDNDNNEKGNKIDKKLSPVAWVLFLSLLLDLVAFTMILPLLPSLLEYYGTRSSSDPIYSALTSMVSKFRTLVNAPDSYKANSILFGGIIGSLFSFLQFLGSPILGTLSDVYGRKPVLLMSMVGISISYYIWGLSTTFSIFVLSRAISGISKGNVSIIIASITDVSNVENRGRGMALVGVAYSIGFLFGPLIGAYYASSLNRQDELFFLIPSRVALALSILCFIVLLFFYKETLPPAARKTRMMLGDLFLLINPISLFRFSSIQHTASFVKSSLFSTRRIGLAYFIYLFIYSGLEFNLGFLVHQRFKYTNADQGKMFCCMGIIMTIVQGGYVRRLKSGTEMRIAKRGILLVIPAFLIIGLNSTSEFVFYIALVLFSFASATVVPCLTTSISNLAPKDQRGRVFGTFRSLGALARALGPISMATIYWRFEAQICYVFGGVLLVIPLIILNRSFSKTLD